jgi:hypothetical protein
MTELALVYLTAFIVGYCCSMVITPVMMSLGDTLHRLYVHLRRQRRTREIYSSMLVRFPEMNKYITKSGKLIKQ